MVAHTTGGSSRRVQPYCTKVIPGSEAPFYTDLCGVISVISLVTSLHTLPVTGGTPPRALNPEEFWGKGGGTSQKRGTLQITWKLFSLSANF